MQDEENRVTPRTDASMPHNLHGRLHLGEEEPIFRAVPADVLANLRHSDSENALLWNLLYPLAQPTIPLARLLALKPLWGTAVTPAEDALVPYFWGVSVAGERLECLDESLYAVCGPTAQTEVDVILLSARNLIVAEVKNRASPGRCARYFAGRCPEVMSSAADRDGGCRYWDPGEAEFDAALDSGLRPSEVAGPPPCAIHYQLARTLLVGAALARRLDRGLHLWLILPKARWREQELSWLDFVERVRDAQLWRRMRVLAWEDIQRLPRSHVGVPRPGMSQR
jgi:hypothetical protein